MTSKFNLGQLNLTTMYNGSTQVKKAYLGSTVVLEDKYNPPTPSDYTQETVTLQVISGGTLYLYRSASGSPTISIKYKINGATEWTTVTTSAVGNNLICEVNAGDYIYLTGNINNTRRTAVTGYTADTAQDYTAIQNSSDMRFNIWGNVLSLNREDFQNQTSFRNTQNNRMSCMFYGCTGIIDASKLIFPQTVENNTATTGTYSYMFRGCTNMVDGPQLLGIINSGTSTASINSLTANYMFYGCSKLKSLTCKWVIPDNTTWKQSNLRNFLVNVASTGTLKKVSSANWSQDSYVGVPSGWTLINI